LSWPPRDYFEYHISTTGDTQHWKNGFPFSLPSIMEKKEFRMTALINEIKSRLEDKQRLLLAGESGTSKTTILMEILTDYFVQGYRDCLFQSIIYRIQGLFVFFYLFHFQFRSVADS
jgi:hypothetical protein